MDKLITHGGKKLNGEVKISGAKNAVLPILAATLLTNEECIIENVPELRDVNSMIILLRSLGSTVEFQKNTIKIKSGKNLKSIAPYHLVSTMRASFCVLGPLVARLGEAEVSLPGGCVIGPRPVDLHIKGIKALGYKIKVEEGYARAKADNPKGTEIFLGGKFGSSVLATANVMMAAVLTPGVTYIESAACEPEIKDLSKFLTQMGAKIEGGGTHLVKITGVKKLSGAKFKVISDRIEAGTILIAAAATGGDVLLKNVVPHHSGVVVNKLKEAGAEIDKTKNTIRIRRQGALSPVDITTLPYPGFPTDLQAQMMALMTVTPGISVITEKIYPERFMHISELSRMGANIHLEAASGIVIGEKKLSGAPVMASDLRASAALVIAGLVAKGRSEIRRVYHLDRGYDKLDQKLTAIGANIKREKD